MSTKSAKPPTAVSREAHLVGAGHNRRREPRYSMMMRMTVATPEDTYAGLATNISHGGLYVVTRHPLPAREAVQLHLPLPSSQEGQPTSASAVTLWSHPIEMGTESLFGTGLRFTAIQPESQNILDTFIASFDPGMEVF